MTTTSLCWRLLVCGLCLTATRSFTVQTTRHVRQHSSRLFQSSTTTDRDVQVQKVLSLAREIGPIGMWAEQEDQDRLVNLCNELKPLTDANPGNIPLEGLHTLRYSDSEGSSSGKLLASPFRIHGRVQQEFEGDTKFINSVEVGPFRAALQADRDIKKDGITNIVKFQSMTVQLFGQTLVDKEISGGGFWKYLFCGTVVDADGTKKLVRVMETPSLFILEQEL